MILTAEVSLFAISAQYSSVSAEVNDASWCCYMLHRHVTLTNDNSYHTSMFCNLS